MKGDRMQIEIRMAIERLEQQLRQARQDADDRVPNVEKQARSDSK